MAKLDDYDRVEVTAAAELRRWLEANADREQGVWLVTYKTSVPEKHVSASAVVDELLCFGWIDSVPRKLDGDRSMVLIAPRKPGSAWSKVNKDKVRRLTTAGLMADAGIRKVAAAKKDGSWSFLDDVEALVIPDDLARALAAARRSERFDALPPSKKKPLLEQIKRAKTEVTRRKRILVAVKAAD